MHRKQKNKTKGKRNKQSKSRFPLVTAHSSFRSFTTIIPDETDVVLKFSFIDSIQGTGQAGKKFTPNAAFDVDPNVGSTETLGFDEYAAFYSYYRVVGYSYTIRVSNCNPTDAVAFYVLNTNTDPSLSGTNYVLYSTNPHCQRRLLSPHPGTTSTETIRHGMSVSRILGSPVVETDDSYRALTTGVPTDLVWLTLVGEAIATNGSDNAINLGVLVDVNMKVRFYGREVDLTLAAVTARMQAIMQAKAVAQAKKPKEQGWKKIEVRN